MSTGTLAREKRHLAAFLERGEEFRRLRPVFLAGQAFESLPVERRPLQPRFTHNKAEAVLRLRGFRADQPGAIHYQQSQAKLTADGFGGALPAGAAWPVKAKYRSLSGRCREMLQAASGFGSQDKVVQPKFRPDQTNRGPNPRVGFVRAQQIACDPFIDTQQTAEE